MTDTPTRRRAADKETRRFAGVGADTRVTASGEPAKRRRARGFRNAPPGMLPARRRRPGEPPKAWNPEYAKAIPYYPKTPEAYALWIERAKARLEKARAEGKLYRKGIPDGWGGKRDILLEVRRRAAEEAKEIIAYMAQKNLIVDDQRAEDALEEMIAIVRAKDEESLVPVYKAAERIQAAKVVLEYTKQKPAQRNDVTVSKAEDFLAQVVIDMRAEPADALPAPDTE